MSELQMEPGWVTPAQLKELVRRRGNESIGFQKDTSRLLKNVGDWLGWPVRLQRDLFERMGISAVVMPLAPGAKLVSDCAPAFEMQEGWVTPTQLKGLIETRGQDAPVFTHTALMQLRDTVDCRVDWLFWPLRLQRELFEKVRIKAVVMPLGLGGRLVDDYTHPPRPNSAAPDRKAFERWVEARGWSHARAGDGYVDPRANGAWEFRCEIAHSDMPATEEAGV